MGEIIPDKNKRLWYNIVSETLCNADVFEELPRWYWDTTVSPNDLMIEFGAEK